MLMAFIDKKALTPIFKKQNNNQFAQVVKRHLVNYYLYRYLNKVHLHCQLKFPL